MTFHLVSNKPREYPFVQIGIKRAEIPLKDFLDTARKIRSLELEYNQTRTEWNEESSTLYDLYQKSRDARYEISTAIDKGPDGKDLYYSNRRVLEQLKLIDSQGEITENAKKILENGTKLNSSHPDQNVRVVITYKEFLTPDSPQKTKHFLTDEELDAMDLKARFGEIGQPSLSEGARQLSGRLRDFRRRRD